jgi:hypothetical protein
MALPRAGPCPSSVGCREVRGHVIPSASRRRSATGVGATTNEPPRQRRLLQSRPRRETPGGRSASAQTEERGRRPRSREARAGCGGTPRPTMRRGPEATCQKVRKGRRKKSAAPVAGTAVRAKTPTNSAVSPNASMPDEPCQAGPLVAATCARATARAVSKATA